MPAISNQNIVLGRGFTESEDTHAAHVAIVGADIVDNMLGAGDPLGKEIRVDGEPYTVIGVGEAQGKMFGQSMDNWVAVPLITYLHEYGMYGDNASLTIYVDAGGGGEVMDSVEDQLRTIMRSQRHLHPAQKDAFNIDSSATFTDILGKILNSFGAVVVSIAACRWWWAAS